MYPTSSSAELLDLYMEFDYEAIEGREIPSQYNVYCDGVLVHIIDHGPGPETFFVESNGASTLSFSLTAVINETGEESPHSNPYLFTVIQKPKAPSGFTIELSDKTNYFDSYQIPLLSQKYTTNPYATAFDLHKTLFTSVAENLSFARKAVLRMS